MDIKYYYEHGLSGNLPHIMTGDMFGPLHLQFDQLTFSFVYSIVLNLWT